MRGTERRPLADMHSWAGATTTPREPHRSLAHLLGVHTGDPLWQAAEKH